jgi:hypothetical protein
MTSDIRLRWLLFAVSSHGVRNRAIRKTAQKMQSRPAAHCRIVYAALSILLFCLLLIAGAYSRLKQECEVGQDRLDAFTLRVMKENVRLDAELANERKAVRDAFERLSQWEAKYPEQAAAFRRGAVEAGHIQAGKD